MVYRTRFYAILAAIIIAVLLVQPVYARRKNKQRELEHSVQKGREFYEEMYYMGAIKKWTDVLKVDPWNEEVKLLIEKALKKYEELSSILEKAYLLLEEGKLDDASGEFTYVQENSSPKNRELTVLVERGLRALEDARRDQHYGALIDQGDRHLGQEDFEDAIARYREAQRFYPEGEVATQRIAITEQRVVEAELDEKLHTLREEGRQFFEDDRLKSSRARWEEVLEIVPGDEEASLFISKIDFKIREQDRLLEMARDYFENGVSLFENGQYENAIDQFENSIAMNYQVKKSRRFIEDSRSAIRKQEEREREVNAQLVAQYLREGIKFYNLNRYRDSLVQLNHGLELDPENTQIREYLSPLPFTSL